ncbi:MAG: hypothetical protein ACYCYE_00570 [Clostridia bacterium]
MRIKYIRFLKGCIALIITVAVLYVGQAIWHDYAVDLPLDKTLNGIDGVEKVTWDDSSNINDSINIYVTLNNTANLQKTHEEINNKIEKTLKNKEFNLEIKDNRSLELEQAYYDIHHYIQKAIVDGDFPLLEEKVQEKAGATGAAAKVYVDEQYIYLQLTKNDSSLYAVVSRHSDSIGGNF